MQFSVHTDTRLPAQRSQLSPSQPLLIASLLACLLAFVGFRLEVHRLMQLGFAHFPYWDDWDTPLGFLASGPQSLKSFLKLLWSQHNESRKITTKLIALVIDQFQVFHSDLTLNLSFLVRVFTVLMVCAPLLIKPLLSRLSAVLRLGILAFCLVLYAVGPANLFNGLWYVQLSFFLGLMFSITSLTLLSLSLHLQSAANQGQWLRSGPIAVLAAVSGVLGIYSFAGNILVLPVSALSILLFEFRGSIGSRLQRLIQIKESRIVLPVLTLAVALYFFRYESPPHHEGLRTNFPHPIYVIKFLSGVYRMEAKYTLVIMALLTALFIALLVGWCLKLLLRPGQQPLRWPITPLVADITFLVGLGALSALGRGREGSDMAFADRYNSFSLLFACVVAVFLLVVVEDLMATNSMQPVWLVELGQAQRRLASGLFLIILSGYMIVSLHANEAWRPMITAYFSERQEAIGCMKDYASSLAKGIDPSRLKPLKECASPLYLHGADKIAQRFPGPWCEASGARRSRTVDSLCRDLGAAGLVTSIDKPLR